MSGLGDAMDIFGPFDLLRNAYKTRKAINRIKSLERNFTGVPHRMTENGNYMDEIEHFSGERWTSDSEDFDRAFAEDNGKILQVFTDKDLPVVELPNPAEGKVYHWTDMPFDINYNGKSRQNAITKRTDLVDRTINLAQKDGTTKPAIVETLQIVNI